MVCITIFVVGAMEGGLVAVAVAVVSRPHRAGIRPMPLHAAAPIIRNAAGHCCSGVST